MKNFENFPSIQVDVQDVASLDIDGQPLIVQILIIHHCWSILDSPQLTIKCWWILGFNCQELTAQILTVCILIVYYCQPTLNSPQLTINYWLSNIYGFGSLRIDCPNLNGVDVDGPLLIANSWQSTFDYYVLMDLNYQQLTV